MNATVASATLTILSDNIARPPLESEHGFAVWIATPSAKILFDTGAGPAMLRNAGTLGIEALQVDAVADVLGAGAGPDGDVATAPKRHALGPGLAALGIVVDANFRRKRIGHGILVPAAASAGLPGLSVPDNVAVPGLSRIASPVARRSRR